MLIKILHLKSTLSFVKASIGLGKITIPRVQFACRGNVRKDFQRPGFYLEYDKCLWKHRFHIIEHKHTTVTNIFENKTFSAYINITLLLKDK